MTEVRVKLSKPYTAHNKVFQEVVVREPTYREIYMDGRGAPRDHQPTPNGLMVATYPGIIDSYLQVLVVEPGYECIGSLSTADALRVGEAVCDFFSTREEPKTRPTGSSSD